MTGSSPMTGKACDGMRSENHVLISRFIRYVIPSVLAFALSGVYAIVDGYFVGNKVGDAGITAINLVYPAVALTQALGTGIGMGGAVWYSLQRASAGQEEADRYVGVTAAYLLMAAAAVTAAFLPATPLFLDMLGASGVVREYGKVYLVIVMSGAVCQIFGTGVTPMVRNCGGSGFSMVIMTAGFITNVVLDFLLICVWDKGVAGAAAATVAGQLVTAVGGVGFLVKKKLPVGRLRFCGRCFSSITKIGLSAFGVTLCPNISLLLMNLFLMKYGGDQAVACYAVVSYASCIVYLMLQGVGDGCQPLFSDYYGKGDLKSLEKVQTIAFAAAEAVGVLCFGLLFLTRNHIGSLFGASPKVCAAVADRMPVILAGFLFLAAARVVTSGFYATGQSGRSVVLVYAEEVFLLALLLILPGYFGETAVWWSMSGAQMLVGVWAVVMGVRSR